MQLCFLTMIIPQDSGILAVRIVFELAAVDLVLGLNGKMIGFGFAAYYFVVRGYSTVLLLPCECGVSSVVKIWSYFFNCVFFAV